MINLKDAEVNRRVPKNRFTCDLSTVDTIIWKYKLSKDTINITDSEQYKELQVFEINFKNKVEPKVFVSIQKAIPYSILFVSDGIYYIVINGNILSTNDKLIDNRILHLNALSIRGIIASIVEQVTGSTGADINATVDNYFAKQRLTKQIDQLEKRMYQEVQPKKKFEMHEELLSLKKQLEELD